MAPTASFLPQYHFHHEDLLAASIQDPGGVLQIREDRCRVRNYASTDSARMASSLLDLELSHEVQRSPVHAISTVTLAESQARTGTLRRSGTQYGDLASIGTESSESISQFNHVPNTERIPPTNIIGGDSKRVTCLKLEESKPTPSRPVDSSNHDHNNVYQAKPQQEFNDNQYLLAPVVIQEPPSPHYNSNMFSTTIQPQPQPHRQPSMNGTYGTTWNMPMHSEDPQQYDYYDPTASTLCNSVFAEQSKPNPKRRYQKRSKSIAIKQKRGFREDREEEEEDLRRIAERDCDRATWIMYNRIMEYRKRHPTSMDRTLGGMSTAYIHGTNMNRYGTQVSQRDSFPIGPSVYEVDAYDRDDGGIFELDW